MGKRFRVGIVGLSAKRGWAAAAHLPALRALSDDFDLIGVANSSPASAESAAAAFGLPRAFESAKVQPVTMRGWTHEAIESPPPFATH